MSASLDSLAVMHAPQRPSRAYIGAIYRERSLDHARRAPVFAPHVGCAVLVGTSEVDVAING